MKKAFWLVGLLCSASLVANATTISYAADLAHCSHAAAPCVVVSPPQDLDNGPAVTNHVWTPIYPMFNPALGTLTSITFHMDGEIAGVYRVENLSSEEESNYTNITIGGEFRLRRTLNNATTLLIVTPLVNLGGVDLSTYDGVTDYAGTSGYDSGVQSASNAGSVTTNLAADLAAHTGVGNFSAWNIRAANNTTASGGGGTPSTVSQVDATSFLEVTYTYTPFETQIPEPTTSALAGGALILVGLLGRKFRR